MLVNRWIALIAFAAAVSACERSPQPASEPADEGHALQQPSPEYDRVVERGAENAREEGRRFIDEAEARLRQLREQLADPQQRKQLTETSRARLEAAAEQLEQDLGRLRSELRRVGEQGAEAWREAQPRLQNAMDRVAATLDRLRSDPPRDEPPPP